jgi:glyoxalase-like protein
MRTPLLCALLALATPCGAASPSPVALDHVWIVASPGAPERKLLEDAGFTIAAKQNRHEGQGTSSITVEFINGYLELIWVDDAVPGSPVVLEKFRNRAQWRTSGWSPIGIGLHRVGDDQDPLPWPSWKIPAAAWLPEGSAMEMLTPRDNPKGPSVFVTPKVIAVDEDRNRKIASGSSKEAEDFRHKNGAKRLTSVRVVAPSPESLAGLPVDDLREKVGVTSAVGGEWVLEVTLDGHAKHQKRDLRPGLPLVVMY